MNRRSLILAIGLIALVAAVQTASAWTADTLRCEYRTDPMGVDVPQPRLSWVVRSDERGQGQRAYRIFVASSQESLALDQPDLWDSGLIQSDQTLHVPYQGQPLKSAQRVYWKVRTWDLGGKPSDWSNTANWTMGLAPDDWLAKWIGAPPNLTAPTLAMRRDFVVKPALSRALVFACGLGQYEMSLNGAKVGDDLLTPGWSKYDKTCIYDVYDVTASIKPGLNAAGILLGNGMYNVVGGRYTKFKGTFGPQKVIAQIVLEYSDGSIEHVGTDERWKMTAGPITFSCVFGGEDFDARLEPRGWKEIGFDPSKWLTARVVDGPGGVLRGLSASAPPLRAIETFKPTSVTERGPGVAVYDLGQNASFMLRLRVKGPAGSVVKVTPAELLRADGTVNRSSVGGGESYWKYTLAGSGSEDYFSKFFYHGCRYLQVERTTPDGAQLPVVESLEGVVVHSTSEPAGEFSSSNELFNRTRTLIRWAQRSNMVSVLSDCPHRERLGWLEQVYLNGASLRYEFDLAQFFTKTMNDMADSQRPDGLVPDIAPEFTVFTGGFLDSPEWGSAFIQAAWQQYEWTGDTALFARHYDGMKRYIAYLKGKSTGGMLNHGLGDWYDLGPNPPGPAQLTPVMLTATAIYWHDLVLMEQIARILEKEPDAEEFAQAAREVRTASNDKLFNKETGQYATGSQTANAMPYALGLVDSANAQKVLDAIVNDVRQRGNALTAGDIGYRYLLRALAMGGKSDVIFDMNNQSDRPGYGYQLARGATALTEGWGGQNSQNHFMLGHIMEWFYHDLAGIGPDPTGPGFKKIIIKPTLAGDLSWVKGSYKSVRGTIRSEWKREGANLTLTITIPTNTSATVYLPTKNANAIQENGNAAAASEGVTFLRTEGATAIYQVESGTYTFVSAI